MILGVDQALHGAEKEKEVSEDSDVENNAALLNSKSDETKGKRVTTSISGLILALVAGIFGGEQHPHLSGVHHQTDMTCLSPPAS